MFSRYPHDHSISPCVRGVTHQVFVVLVVGLKAKLAEDFARLPGGHLPQLMDEGVELLLSCILVSDALLLSCIFVSDALALRCSLSKRCYSARGVLQVARRPAGLAAPSVGLLAFHTRHRRRKQTIRSSIIQHPKAGTTTTASNKFGRLSSAGVFNLIYI